MNNFLAQTECKYDAFGVCWKGLIFAIISQ